MDQQSGQTGMSMLSLVATFCAAGALAVCIKWLSTKQNFELAGLAAMLPVNTFIGWYLVKHASVDGFEKAVSKGIAGAVCVMVLVVVTYGLLRSGVSVRVSVTLGVASWMLTFAASMWLAVK